MTFETTIDRLADSGRPDESLFRQLCESSHEASDEDLARLATVLANSGPRLIVAHSSDVASTGGPSSLTTLICPLFLVLLGWKVPKIGVTGRPAGGVDVMGALDGYSVDLDPSRAEEVLESTGYVHLDASRFAPLDRDLFDFRRRNNVYSPPLAISSLVSKKLAVGLERAALDIRVWETGNFGRTVLEARGQGARFNKVCGLVGIRAVTGISNLERPLQPYIGRGESLLAVAKVFDGSMDTWLAEHVQFCWELCCAVAGEPSSTAMPDGIDVQQVFEANLAGQGSSARSFADSLQTLAGQPREIVVMPQNGHFKIDLLGVKTAVVAAQDRQGGRFPDPCGIVLQRRPGEYVPRGTTVLVLRGKVDEEVLSQIRRCVSASPEALSDRVTYEIMAGPGISS